MPNTKDLQILLTELLPEKTAAHYSAALPQGTMLLPEEQLHTHGMVAKRVNEFTHGRYCARTAMSMLDMSPQPIGKGANREPLWPTGVIGSITHTTNAAAAVVASCHDFRSLGLDMESPAPLKDELLDMICLAEENPERDGSLAKLLFSIKEAIYKCLYPEVGEYIDFLEMHVELDFPKNSFCAGRLTKAKYMDLAAQMRGRFTIHEEYVISAAWLTR
jgi:4'-phosphopantetheinyl transferase EntD